MNAKRFPFTNDSGIGSPCSFCSSGQLGLGVEEFELTRPAGHEQENDGLGLRLEVWRLRGERIDRWCGLRVALEQ